MGNVTIQPSAPTPTTATVTEAIRQGVRDALLTHAKLGQSVAVDRDGKVVWLSPAEIFATLGVEPPRYDMPAPAPEAA